MKYGDQAVALFKRGYNCAQSVFCAFCDVTGIPMEEALRLSSSFGGGIGRLRETCGAFSGLCMAAGFLYGYADPVDQGLKRAHYARIQDMAEEFRAEFSSLRCGDILKNPDSSPNPTPRTAEFYEKRPCARCIWTAADILERYMLSHPLPEGKESAPL